MTKTRFGHDDLIDSTQMQTDESGAAIDLNGAGGGTGPVSYTAFGEAVGVGGWGEGGSGSAGTGGGFGGGGQGGAGVSPAAAYTAFGEAVGPAGIGDASMHASLGTRYQYAGGWGYESGLLSLAGANASLPPITLQHLGWRWYQADSGRFVQRDPIGLEGGTNVYAYVNSHPFKLDPRGLRVWEEIDPSQTRLTYLGTDEEGCQSFAVEVLAVTYDDGGFPTASLMYGAASFALGVASVCCPPIALPAGALGAITGGVSVYTGIGALSPRVIGTRWLLTDEIRVYCPDGVEA